MARATKSVLIPGANVKIQFIETSDGSGVFVPMTESLGGTAATGSATETKQDTQITALGSLTETSPATDTASSGLNGRLQRIAQRLTSLITSLASIDSKVSRGKLGTGGTGTAAALAAAIGSSLACQSVLLTNTHATLTLLFGNVTAQVVPLLPGAFVSIPASNVNQIYIIDGSGHATFAYLPVVDA